MLQTFHKRLKCNTDCEELEKGSPERDQCETENCIEMPRHQEEIEEEYDYSYGYEDESVNEIIEVSPRTSEETSWGKSQRFLFYSISYQLSEM